MRNLLIIGAGGFAKEVIWTALEMNRSFSRLDRWQIIGFADDDDSKKGREVFGFPVLGRAEEAVSDRDDSADIWYHCATGHNKNRAHMAARLEALGCRAATIMHPSALVAPCVQMGGGCYVGAFTVINPDVTLGDHVLINQRVAIGHDAVLQSFSQVNPGGQINGMCRVGRFALVGSNASLHPGVQVGDHAVVGANSQVLRNVPAGSTVNGVPAIQAFSHKQ